jgi:hypothetical protein
MDTDVAFRLSAAAFIAFSSAVIVFYEYRYLRRTPALSFKGGTGVYALSNINRLGVFAVVSRARKTLRISSANSGCFIERGRRDRCCTQHAKIPSRSSLTSDTYE